MSEQILSSAAGGVLSLNLSVMPQGASPGQSGAAPLFTGFSSMLNQQSVNQAVTAEFDSGVVLPSDGATLPQGVLPEGQSPETEQEFMRQQMMQVALMLEQQRASDADLPVELSAELARALKEYAGQQPVLPQEVSSNAASSEVADKGQRVAAPGDPMLTAQSVANPAAIVASDLVSTQAPDNISPPSAQTDQANSKVPQSAVTPAQQVDSTSLLNAENKKSEGVAEAVAPKVMAPAQVEAEKVDASAIKNVEQSERPVKAEVAQTVIPSEQALKQEGKAKASEAVFPGRGADHAASQAGERANERSAVVTGNISSGQTAEASNTAQLSNKQQPSEQVATKVIADQQPVTAKSELAKSNEVPVQQSFKPEPLPINKPEGQTVQKFENALDMTQQLLQKVSSGEKIDNSATQLVEKIANSSSLQPSTTQSLVMPTNAQKNVAESQNLMMPQQVKINTPAWNNALGERAVMIAAQNTRVAEIQLDPPELGSLHVRVNVNQDQVSLSFTSPHAHVRDAVEQSLPRLREMFAEQGLALQDSSVSDHSSDQKGRERLADGSDNGGAYGTSGSVEGESEAAEPTKRSVSLVDYYA